MSDCTDVIMFDKNNLRLEMRFEQDDFKKASVRYKLMTRYGEVIEESPAIPVAMLFNLLYLADVSVRRNAILIEREIQEMAEFSKVTGQSFQPIIEENKDGKEDQTK